MVFSPPIFLCYVEKGQCYFFETLYTHFWCRYTYNFDSNLLLLVVLYCNNNTHNNAKETIGITLTNGQKDGHRHLGVNPEF